MTWLARLKENKNALDGKPTKPTKASFVGFVGVCSNQFQKTEGELDRLATGLAAANDAESGGSNGHGWSYSSIGV